MSEKNIKIASKINTNDIYKPSNIKWDKCLVDYKNYTKEYIKHYKKSINGNCISLSIYPHMKAKSEALFAQLFLAQEKDFLTKKQIKKNT